MRAVVQRVLTSDVTVNGKITGAIGKGLAVLLGVEEGDTPKDAEYMAGKITGLRIFEDEEGKMNLSLLDISGELLAVSQFTLFGDCRKGKRPSFSSAAKPWLAESLYREFIDRVRALGVPVQEGVFQAKMLLRIENDGPVTLLIDSKKVF